MSLVVVRRPAFEPSFDPTCWLYRPVSSDVAVDPATPQVAAELARQAAIVNPWLNYNAYTAALTEVPADQPLTPVKLWRGGWTFLPPWAVKLSRTLAGGVPIPDGFMPNTGTDSEACFYQPDYVGPTGYQGRYYELWTMRRNTGPDAAEFPWVAGWGGKTIATNLWPGHFIDWYYDQDYSWQPGPGYRSSTPSHPDSTYQERSWGTTATSLPLRDLEITGADLQRGRIDHLVGLAVIYSGWPHRSPAQRSDSNQASNVVREGMRLFLDADCEIPVGLHPVARIIAQAAKDYGLVIWDQAGALSFRCEPGAQRAWAGTPTYDVLGGFPWADLRVMA